MPADPAEAAATLNRLIGICRDSQVGFRAASEAARHVELKALLHDYSTQRQRFVGELEAEVRRLGGTPEDVGTVARSLHRGWINLLALVAGHDDPATIAQCERGEEAARAAYEQALHQALPPQTVELLRRQSAAICEAHDRIQALERATAGRSP